MKLPSNIKIKGMLWNFTPLLLKNSGTAIYPNIYVTKQVYEDLNSSKRSVRAVALLLHEQTHIERQKENGWLKWELNYLFSSKFRFNEELVATKSEMKYFKKRNCNFDTSRRAKLLSGYLYLWCSSYEFAKEKLDKAWEEID